jgi:hypothetical protein
MVSSGSSRRPSSTDVLNMARPSIVASCLHACVVW